MFFTSASAHERRLPKIALTFRILGDEDVTLALFTPKNLSGASDFESLGHGLLGFGLSGYSCHRSAEDIHEIPHGNHVFRWWFAPWSGTDQAGLEFQTIRPLRRLLRRWEKRWKLC